MNVRSSLVAMVVVTVMALAALACGSERSTSAPTEFSTNASTLIDKVPATSFAVAVLDSRQPLWSFLTDGLMLPNRPETKAALSKELSAFVKQRFGVDVTRVSSAVIFATPRSGRPPAAGILVQGVEGTLKGKAARSYNSVKMYELSEQISYAQVGPTLYAGDPDAVRAALDVAGGTLDSLDKGNPKLARLARRYNGGAFLSVAAHLAGAQDPGLADMRRMSGVDHVAMRLGGDGVRAIAIGNPEKMKAGVALLRSKLGDSLDRFATMKERATKSDAPAIAGMAAIVQYHMFKNILAQLKPKIAGKQLTIRLPVKLGDQSTILLGFVGIAAATAIPTFLRYTKKAKKSEVRSNLRKMYDAARRYQQMHGRLPPSIGPTPALGSCCKSGNDKCQPSLLAWQSDTWRQLGFSVDEPHYYMYSFVRKYDGFVVRANGDLDCDTEYSTFEMTATFQGGQVPSYAPLYREQELE